MLYRTGFEAVAPVSDSDTSRDILLLDVGPLLPSTEPDDRELTEAEPERGPRKDSGEAHLDYLTITMTNVSLGGDGLGGFEDASGHVIHGTDQSEMIYGIDTRDIIYAGLGNDTVIAGDGSDTVYGEKGRDFIDLGDGDDIAYGGLGNDSIYGGNGNDSLSGGPGDDVLHAGADGWLNVLNGGHGRDTMVGSSFAGVTDVFQFTEAEDAPTGGAFPDQISNFRDGEDFIWLVFDADTYQPGHQGFEIVAEDDAGTAGTIWLDTEFAHAGTTQSLLTLALFGHTDNDGQADFAMRVHMRLDPDEIDVTAEDAAYQALTADDFIFG